MVAGTGPAKILEGGFIPAGNPTSRCINLPLKLLAGSGGVDCQVRNCFFR